MDKYIERFLRSRKESATLIVATTDGPHTLLVKWQAGQTMLSVEPDWPNSKWNKVEESLIREFFKSRGMKPIKENRSANPIYDDGILGFEFQLSGDRETI